MAMLLHIWGVLENFLCSRNAIKYFKESLVFCIKTLRQIIDCLRFPLKCIFIKALKWEHYIGFIVPHTKFSTKVIDNDHFHLIVLSFFFVSHSNIISKFYEYKTRLWNCNKGCLATRLMSNLALMNKTTDLNYNEKYKKNLWNQRKEYD